MTTAQNTQRQNAAGKLEELAGEKFELKRPVFFIPGRALSMASRDKNSEE
jgi:hypothetical protein